MPGEGYSNSKPAEVVTAPELRQDGPTIEEYVRAGYPAKNYPPAGWAEKDSPGLAAFRAYQADPHDAKKHAEAAAALGISVGEVEHGRLVEPGPVSALPVVGAPTAPAVDTTSPAADNQAV